MEKHKCLCQMKSVMQNLNFGVKILMAKKFLTEKKTCT